MPAPRDIARNRLGTCEVRCGKQPAKGVRPEIGDAGAFPTRLYFSRWTPFIGKIRAVRIDEHIRDRGQVRRLQDVRVRDVAWSPLALGFTRQLGGLEKN